jgi:hypothetical protein
MLFCMHAKLCLSLDIQCSGTYFDPKKRLWKLQNEQNMYYCPHKTVVIESRRMRWAEHEVWRQATNFWEGKSRVGAMWKICNRKTNHEHVSSVNLVPQDRIKGRVFIMLKKKSNFLSNLVPINIQKKTTPCNYVINIVIF